MVRLREYCLPAVPAAPGQTGPRPDDVETNAASWWNVAATGNLAMHPAMRLRLENVTAAPDLTHYDRPTTRP